MERVVDVVGYDTVIQMANECVRKEIIWFSSCATDVRRTFPLDLQYKIVSMLINDRWALWCMYCTCKHWRAALLYLFGKYLTEPIRRDGERYSITMVGCRGLIVPHVLGDLKPGDQRRPVVCKKKGHLLLMSLKPQLVTLYDDNQREVAFKKCLRFSVVPFRFPAVSDQSDCVFCVCAYPQLGMGAPYVVQFPVRFLAASSIREIRLKMRQEWPHMDRPAGYCISCGMNRKRSGPCSRCGEPSSTIEQAYGNWVEY